MASLHVSGEAQTLPEDGKEARHAEG